MAEQKDTPSPGPTGHLTLYIANTDTKLLIYGLFQKGRVLAQDGVTESPKVAAA